MKKDREGTKIYLIDIRYRHSINHFEEIYGESVNYSYIEQESYIDLKKMVAEAISDKIKFRKHERDGMVLTLKVEMLDQELENLKYLIESEELKFLHDYVISDIKEYKPQ